MRSRKIFIVGGGGMVGATAAQVIATKELASEIVLIDVAEDLVRGQAMDINHATAYTHGVKVRVGDYSELEDNDIVVITSGVGGVTPGKTRLDFIGTNANIVRDVVGQISAQNKDVFIVMVTNPVAVLTYVALKQSGFPKQRVFGTGTMLDTARLCVELAQKLHVSQRYVQAFVLGEHGDSSFAALTQTSVGGIPLKNFPGYSSSMTDTIENDVRLAAQQIVAAKKSTYYGIAQVIAKIIDSLAHDTGRILTTCSLAEGEYGLTDVVVGLPCLVSSKGAKILEGYPLSTEEQAKLQKSAGIVQKVIKELPQ